MKFRSWRRRNVIYWYFSHITMCCLHDTAQHIACLWPFSVRGSVMEDCHVSLCREIKWSKVIMLCLRLIDWLPVYLSLYLSVSLTDYLSVWTISLTDYLSFCLSVCLSDWLPVCLDFLSVCPFIFLFDYLSVCVDCLCVCPVINLSVCVDCLCVCPVINLSVCVDCLRVCPVINLSVINLSVLTVYASVRSSTCLCWLSTRLSGHQPVCPFIRRSVTFILDIFGLQCFPPTLFRPETVPCG